MSAIIAANPSTITPIYPYEPSKAAAGIFYVLFAISGIAHAVQVSHYKSWRSTLLLPWASTLYTVGFILRQVSSVYPLNIGLYIASVVLLFCAPPVYAGANYFLLGRTLHYIPYQSPIHPGRVVTTFVGIDFFIEVLTAVGASRLALYNKPEQVKIGLALIRASIVLQVVLFIGFVAIQATFHLRCIRAKVLSPNIRCMLYVLYASNALILVRNIYRVVDVFLGNTGYTETHEAFMYCFDALPMLFNSFLLNIIYPPALLPLSNKTYLSQDGHTERVGPGWQDQRPFLTTLLDPTDCMGLIRGEDRKNRFWEHEEEHPIAAADATIPTRSKNRIDPYNIGGSLIVGSAKGSEVLSMT